MKLKIIVWQDEKREIIEAKQGDNLLEILQKNGFNLNSACGGIGSCGKCKVKFISAPPKISEAEKRLLSKLEIEAGVRLACLIKIDADMELAVAKKEELTIMTAGVDKEVDLEPVVRKVELDLEQGSLADQRDIVRRISDQLGIKELNLAALKSLAQLDLTETLLATIKDKEIINFVNKKEELEQYGIAIDIGTTTIVLYLIDLSTGVELDLYSLANPQRSFGADVISRVNYTLEDRAKVLELKDSLLAGINQGVAELIKANQIDRADILVTTVVGNTIMLHTLLGLSAKSIVQAPYIPLFTDGLKLMAQEVGLKISRQGLVELVPSIASYVGADIMAGILATDLADTKDEWNLLIDIGTNGELVLGNGEEFFACATAAGPALEGANITYGMAGVKGAIRSYKIKGEGIKYSTIANRLAQGICGSGLIDIVAELYKAGFLNQMGAFVAKDKLVDWQQKRMTEYNKQRAYKVVTADEADIKADILLTQKDIRELQLAKGAILAGIKILLKQAKIDYKSLNKLYLAGGFGNYLKIENACLIGLLPQKLAEKIVPIGNAAGIGAKLYLKDKKLLAKAEQIKDQTKYLELSASSDFQTEFMAAMNFESRQ